MVNTKQSTRDLNFQVSDEWLYKDQSIMALTTAYQMIDFGFDSIFLNMSNDGIAAEIIYFSWDGVNLAGTIKAGESFTIQKKRETKIYLKGSAGGESYRLFAW